MSIAVAVETECAASEAGANPLLALSDEELVARLCPPTTVEAWTFTAAEIREAIRGERILCPSIELSNVCNLNCPYCYVETTDSPTKQRYPDQLTLAELERVVKSLAEAGARTINITGAGEPTMDPVFERVVRLIASLGIRPLVATNGIKLGTSTEMVRLFVETRASVVFLLPCSAPQN